MRKKDRRETEKEAFGAGGRFHPGNAEPLQPQAHENHGGGGSHLKKEKRNKYSSTG